MISSSSHILVFKFYITETKSKNKKENRGKPLKRLSNAKIFWIVWLVKNWKLFDRRNNIKSFYGIFMILEFFFFSSIQMLISVFMQLNHRLAVKHHWTVKPNSDPKNSFFFDKWAGKILNVANVCEFWWSMMFRRESVPAEPWTSIVKNFVTYFISIVLMQLKTT